MNRPRTAILPDEPELGEQRYCKGCGEWWPHDEEFFGVTVTREGWRRTWCRACRFSQWATTQHGRRTDAA